MNKSKQSVFVNGSVLLPLKIGERAVIFQSNGSTKTSIVEAINQVADNFITFETDDSVYCVKGSKTPVPMALAAA